MFNVQLDDFGFGFGLAIIWNGAECMLSDSELWTISNWIYVLCIVYGTCNNKVNNNFFIFHHSFLCLVVNLSNIENDCSIYFVWIQNVAEFRSYEHFHNKYQFLWGVCEG